MNIMWSLFVTICLVSISLIDIHAFTIDNCDKDVAALASLGDISISDCAQNTEDPSCLMERGTNKSITINFTPNTRIDKVKVGIVGKIRGLPIHFPLNPNDACGNYGFDCPLESDKKVTFKLMLPIRTLYPKYNVQVVLKLIDSAKKPIVCISFPAKITDKSQ